MTWTAEHLPNLQALTRMDACLRQVATDEAAVREAIAMAMRALEDARRNGNDRVQATMLGYMTDAHRILGELESAERYAREGIALGEAMGSASIQVAARIRLGEVLRCGGRCKEAIREHLGALESIGDEATEAYRDFALQHLGKAYLNAGRRDEAVVALREALRIRRRKGVPALVDSTQEAIAYAVSGRGTV